MKFIRSKPIIALESFLHGSGKVKDFTSSSGKRYRVLSIENNTMKFIRLDAASTDPWEMDLKGVYRAYSELEDFSTISFKKFVPRKHSPARGLLLHLKLLKPKA